MPIVIRVIQSDIERWTEHVACMGEKAGGYKILVDKKVGKDYLRELGLHESLIIKLIIKYMYDSELNLSGSA